MLPCSVLKEEEEEEEEDLYFDTNIRKAYNVVGSCVKKKKIMIKSLSTIKRIIKIKTAIASYMYTIYSKTITYR